VVLGCLPLAVFPAMAAWTGRLLGSSTPFVSMGCLLSLLPGKLGGALRVAYYSLTVREIALDAQIGFGTFFSKPEIIIRPRVRMGAYCILGSCVLEEDVVMASRISVTSGRHQHGSGNAGVHFGASEFQSVRIGARTWVGEGAIIMADVGADSIVGAGSVVVRAIPRQSVAVGNPAHPRDARAV
jgi:acetyltransferase-like isoleucine patch superfamily enzyme